MFDSNIFKERLRKTREELGITQADFAKKVGMARASASYYENINNDALPNIELFCKMCDVLEVSPQYLIGASNTKTNNIDNILIHEKLGLSEKSINALEVYQKRKAENCSLYSNHIDILNDLISSFDFSTVIGQINRYMLSVKKCDNADIIRREAIQFYEENEIEKFSQEWLDMERERQKKVGMTDNDVKNEKMERQLVELYHMQNDFIKIIKELYSSKIEQEKTDLYNFLSLENK